MSTLRTVFRREPVLIIAALATLISCFLIPPDDHYLEYIDWRTLALLYCLMVAVSGLRRALLFTHMAHTLCSTASSVRVMGFVLVGLCFFSSMLMTNDVALITFVPFAVAVMILADRKRELIWIVVLQTVAANLGSMLTPMGNPQNLYLYSFYDLSFRDFISATLPVWALSGILLILACVLLPGGKITTDLGEAPGLDRRLLALYLGIFGICLLCVLRILSWPVMLAAVIAVLLFLDRKTLLKADFMLLLTFVAFFVFSGNLARLDFADTLLRKVLEGREYITSLLTSQVISNVPAALLLSGFTRQSHALLLGVNVGGLGTPVASLASLISLKLYSRSSGAATGRYLLVFTAVNVLFLILLSAVVFLAQP